MINSEQIKAGQIALNQFEDNSAAYCVRCGEDAGIIAPNRRACRCESCGYTWRINMRAAYSNDLEN